ncbi:SHOCT-like domain-containing protein [Liberiplasma polymorphum]|uniref:SHOCT-like domain-containing protein n=1 Tax=Liberiplasma polymorphum TaxID=3374570 RepID=UPI00377117C7
MSQEKLKILEMIGSKIITPSEGAELLKAIDSDSKGHIKIAKKEAFKMFKVRILSADGDKVNVQIPLEFAKVALKSGGRKGGFMKFDKLNEMDVDIDFDMILDMIERGTLGKIVDIESGDGDKVEIVIE